MKDRHPRAWQRWDREHSRPPGPQEPNGGHAGTHVARSAPGCVYILLPLHVVLPSSPPIGQLASPSCAPPAGAGSPGPRAQKERTEFLEALAGQPGCATGWPLSSYFMLAQAISTWPYAGAEPRPDILGIREFRAGGDTNILAGGAEAERPGAAPRRRSF